MNLKKELIVVFHPYVKPGAIRPFRYKITSANRLTNYIPLERAIKEINKFFKNGLQKDNFYVAKCGKVYFYRK